MRKRESYRVQRLPLHARDRALYALLGNAAPLRSGVDGIADDRMSDVFEVHANLMRASRAQRAAEERDVAQSLRDLILGDGAASVRDDGHAFAVARIAARRGIGEIDLDPLSAFHPLRRFFRRSAVQPDVLFFDQTCERAAAVGREELAQRTVEPETVLSGCDCYKLAFQHGWSIRRRAVTF